MKDSPWYASVGKNSIQGIVISEKTGANIAVVYDPANTYVLAAAPEMLDICDALMNTGLIETYGKTSDGNPSNCTCHVHPELEAIIMRASRLLNKIKDHE